MAVLTWKSYSYDLRHRGESSDGAMEHRGFLNQAGTSVIMLAALVGCAAPGAEIIMEKATANCLIDHPRDEPKYHTACAECVQEAGKRIIAPTLTPNRLAAWQEILLAQEVDAGKLTPALAEALSSTTLAECVV